MANKVNCQGLTLNGGFTLVEAVLALAILSIGVFVLVEATAKCLSVVRLSRDYQNVRAVLGLGDGKYPLATNRSVERISVAPVEFDDYPGYYYSRDPQDGDEEKLVKVITRVTWSDKGKDSCEEMVGYLYCPNAE